MGSALSCNPTPQQLDSCRCRSRGRLRHEHARLACGVRPPEQFLRSEWCSTIDQRLGRRSRTRSRASATSAPRTARPRNRSRPRAWLAGPARAGWEGFLRPDAYLLIIVVAARTMRRGPGIADADLSARRRRQGVSSATRSGSGFDHRPRETAPPETSPDRAYRVRAAVWRERPLLGLCSGQLPARWTASLRTSTTRSSPCVQRTFATRTPRRRACRPNCAVEDTQGPDRRARSPRMLPSCDESAPPCWRLTAAATASVKAIMLGSSAAPDWCFEAGTTFTIECLGCADANDPACAVSGENRAARRLSAGRELR